MTEADLDDKLNAIERLIQEGNVGEARGKLSRIAHRAIPRRYRGFVASLLRRAGLFGDAVGVLHPLVRVGGKTSTTASAEEIAEYAASLIKIGAPAEAETLLAALDSRKLPQVSLYGAFAKFARWDYEGAIPLLESYLNSPGLDSYKRLVGKVNLAAALVTERRAERAEPLLQELREEARQHKKLLGNVFELSAQNGVFSGDAKSSARFLDETENHLLDPEGLEAMFVRKWRCVWKVLFGGADPAAFETIRAEARKRGHWETLRHCDLFEAKATASQAIAIKLYFGTPQLGFRRQLLSEFPGLSVPSEYRWNLIEGSKGRELALDSLGEQVPDRLLKFLASDFYRPYRLAEIHHAIYPEEFFNPLSSAERVRQVVMRVRRGLSKRLPQVKIDVTDGLHRILAKRAATLVVAHPDREQIPSSLRLLKLQRPADSFSVSEAASIIGTSSRSAQRLIADAVRDGILEKQGKARATIYRFPSEESVQKLDTPRPEKKRAG